MVESRLFFLFRFSSQLSIVFHSECTVGMRYFGSSKDTAAASLMENGSSTNGHGNGNGNGNGMRSLRVGPNRWLGSSRDSRSNRFEFGVRSRLIRTEDLQTKFAYPLHLDEQVEMSFRRKCRIEVSRMSIVLSIWTANSRCNVYVSVFEYSSTRCFHIHDRNHASKFPMAIRIERLTNLVLSNYTKEDEHWNSYHNPIADNTLTRTAYDWYDYVPHRIRRRCTIVCPR